MSHTKARSVKSLEPNSQAGPDIGISRTQSAAALVPSLEMRNGRALVGSRTSGRSIGAPVSSFQNRLRASPAAAGWSLRILYSTTPAMLFSATALDTHLLDSTFTEYRSFPVATSHTRIVL